jgi:hypothetical protein
MASTSTPSGSPRVLDDNGYELVASAWGDDGILGALGDTAVVYADSSGRQVKIRSGKYGHVRGKIWAAGATDIVKTISANVSGQPRIDLVVLGLDRSTWAVTEYVKTGTAAATPAAPALQRDTAGAGTGKWEIPIAQVAVAAGVSTINAGDVTPIQGMLTPGGLVFADTATLGRWPTLTPGTRATVVDQPYTYSTVNGWRRSDWYTAWGQAAAPTSATLAGTTGTATATRDAVLGNVAFTALAGRMYEASVTGVGLSGTAGELYLYSLKDGGSAAPVAASTQLAFGTWRCQATGGPGQETMPVLTKRQTFTPGLHTIALFTQLYVGTHAVIPIGDRQLTVTDVGPA